MARRTAPEPRDRGRPVKHVPSHWRRAIRNLALLLPLSALLGGCVTSTVDQMVFNEPVEGIGDATVVILGRRHASDYETEFDFIECVANHIVARDPSIEILDEIEFINSMYPWFLSNSACNRM